MTERQQRSHLRLVHTDGKPLGLTGEEKATITRLYRTGITPTDVSEVFGRKQKAVKRYLGELEAKVKKNQHGKE